jgi:hypothetical protein
MKLILAIGLISPFLSIVMSAPRTKSGKEKSGGEMSGGEKSEMWIVYKNGKVYTADKDTDENWSKLAISIFE